MRESGCGAAIMNKTMKDVLVDNGITIAGQYSPKNAV